MSIFFAPPEVPPDLIHLIRKTTSGTFYESLQTAETTRDKLKTNVFAFLYGDLNVMKHSRIAPRFKAIYPTVAETIEDLKNQKGYRWLGQELQRRESSVVINSVVGMIMDLDKDEFGKPANKIPLITVHDSILTTPEHARTVELCLKQALMARNYYTPRLKTTSHAA